VSYLDVQVTAPVDGHVTISYSTFINNVALGQKSVCNVYRSTEIPASIRFDDPGVGWWEAADQGDEGSVSGTNRFDISAGQSVTYSLACEESGTGASNGAVAGRAMTAIFTPAP
jgi:hypothetical protein